MQKNYSPRLVMQIPKENAYTGLSIKPDIDEEFERLSKTYDIHEIHSVNSFIEQHKNILGFINEITPLINDYFPDYKKIIEFCKDPELNELDFIMIYIEGISFDEDYEKLKKFKNEPLYLSKFSKNINGLVCVELW